MARKIRVKNIWKLGFARLSYCFNRILILAKTTECLINSHPLAVFWFYLFICVVICKFAMLGIPSISLNKIPNFQDSKTEDCLKNILHPDLLATKNLSYKPLNFYCSTPLRWKLIMPNMELISLPWRSGG